MMKRNSSNFFSLDFILILASLALTVIGIMFIYSSGVNSQGILFSNEYLKQILWAITGLILMLLAAFTDIKTIKSLSMYFYAIALFLLIITLFFGSKVNGARSWLGFMSFGIQPSEFMKIATILLLASYYENNKSSGLGSFLIALLIFLVPFGIILLQPDMGTALVYIPLFLIISFLAGVKKRYILFFFLWGLLTIFLGVLPAYETEIAMNEIPLLSIIKEGQSLLYVSLFFLVLGVISLLGFFLYKRQYYYWLTFLFSIILFSLIGSYVFRLFIKEYQITRLIVFLDPSIDSQGAGWNVIQSVTAVGSGGFWGKGFLQGTQSHYNFLPQQSTDFIFSIIAEEWGFFGSIFIFILIFIILLRGMLISYYSKTAFDSLVAIGIVSIIFFHSAVNIGMAIGIMPITGIPLYFVSYGGSSIWTIFIGIGLLLNINLRRTH